LKCGGESRTLARVKAGSTWRRTVPVVLALCGLVAAAASETAAPNRAIPLDRLLSGRAFQAPETRAMEDDELGNPGMLWVEEGAALWAVPPHDGARACAACHGDAGATMRGVATRYPRHDPRAGRVVDLQGRVALCRDVHQQAPPLAHESRQSLALAAFVARQSHGMSLAVEIDGAARSSLENGERLFFQRQGQSNLACAHCHDANWGRLLGGERLSQGHPNGYPAYRLEWQAVGSLQRRLRACAFGVRAEMPAYGAQELVDLALYLAWRAQGLAIETPAVRR
jgi:L-cysteine S-thiosulfotransferase